METLTITQRTITVGSINNLPRKKKKKLKKAMQFKWSETPLEAIYIMQYDAT